MADKPADKTLLPTLLAQNPAPVEKSGQDRIKTRREQVDSIMSVFMQLLPSNYVAQVQGPFYTIQFQAIAEQIADFQITAQEAFSDSDYDYLRGEFLFQLLGTLVFPDANSDGYPTLEGDLTYREFLKRMVQLLLQGATKPTIEGGLELLADATWSVIEKSIAARETFKKVWNPTTGRWERQPGSAWGLDDQFEFEVNVTYTDPETGEQRFPPDPFVLAENVRIVLRALKPAHTLYDYRHLFQETFGQFFTATSSWELSNYYYEDFRRFCCGAKQVSGTAGVTWSDKTLFSDTSREFDQITAGAELTVLSGPNSINASTTDRGEVGRYRVADLLYFPIATDTIPRTYTTSPSNFRGEAVVTANVIEDRVELGLAGQGLKIPDTTAVRFLSGEFFIRVGDLLVTPVGVAAFSPVPDPDGIEYLTANWGSNPVGTLALGSNLLADHEGELVSYVADWGSAVEGEVLTFTAGPNAGSYRLKTLLGNNGGLVGEATGPATKVRPALSLLRTERRMKTAATGQQYVVAVDRLGVQEPREVTGEDASIFFVL